jgi:hypothetical protein
MAQVSRNKEPETSCGLHLLFLPRRVHDQLPAHPSSNSHGTNDSFIATDPGFKNASVAALIIAATIPFPSPLSLEGDKACTTSWTSILGFCDKIKQGESIVRCLLAPLLLWRGR